jgi:hypothetical protein
VEETKKKRREFGARIAFPTGDKIRHFVLEIRFKQKLDDTAADGSTLNLHGIHGEFVSKLMASTEGDAHLMPTAKEKEQITTTPCPIVNVDSFLSSDRNHRKFFHRTIYYSEWNKRTVVKNSPFCSHEGNGFCRQAEDVRLVVKEKSVDARWRT